jgi:hypothetical protein
LDYNVDLPAGVLSVRQIVNFCCGADPTTVFEMGPDSWGVADIEFWPITLGYGNPFAMPRAAAVRFWELEIGKPANGTPTMDEVVAAMSDRNPGKRRAAQLYQKAASVNYPPNELTKKITDSEKKLWVWLAVMIPPLTFAKDSEFFVSSFSNNFVPLSNDLKQVQDPRLALLWSLELARAKQDTSYLDAIVSGHKFSEADIAGIKPDVYKVARVSKSVREKCIQLKLDVPEFSPENLRELERTNLFHLIPEEKVQ